MYLVTSETTQASELPYWAEGVCDCCGEPADQLVAIEDDRICDGCLPEGERWHWTGAEPVHCGCDRVAAELVGDEPHCAVCLSFATTNVESLDYAQAAE